MSLMQLHTGDVWEIDGERHYLDRILEGGFLVLRAFETGQPYQRLTDTGEARAELLKVLEGLLRSRQEDRRYTGDMLVTKWGLKQNN